MNRKPKPLDAFELDELRGDFNQWLAKQGVWIGFFRLPSSYQNDVRAMLKRAYYAGDKRRRMLDEPTALGGDY